MTFKEYVDQLNNMLCERPDLGDMDVVYDAGGNGYRTVVTPTLGHFDYEDFLPESCFGVYQDNYDTQITVNAVCIN